jgi:hypothetical protein
MDNTLGAILDIEGGFHRTSFDIIQQAAERHGIEPAVCRLICSTLESRNISATWSQETLGATRARGCPQGCVLSPLLWSLLVDDIFGDLKIMAVAQ